MKLSKDNTLTVGGLRQQTALAAHDRPVILVTQDAELAAILTQVRIVNCYPDTTDAARNVVDGGTFKIEIARVK